MDPEVEALLERRFRAPEPRGDVVVSLDEAIERHVRPGDAVHLGVTHTRWSAAFWELLRQFRGTDPAFDLLAVQFTTPGAALVHADLARRLVTSWIGDSYMSPGANPVYQRAFDTGLEIEHWSLLTFVQRLAAAARGHAWTTTTSLAGSTMGEENAPHAYRELEPGLGLVSALVPDVSILHAPAADPFGNVLLSPPLMENVYGALAARRGAIVTVERLVEPEYLRSHAHLTRIPASAVAAVVEAPLGGHPGGLVPAGLDDAVEGYADDFEFWLAIREASRDPRLMEAWIRDWVLDRPTHEAYVKLLGAERVAGLRRRVRPETWREDLEAALPQVDLDAGHSALEAAIVTGSRVLAERIRAEGHRVILAGAGMANLAAWLAAFALRDEGIPVDLAAEMGLIGYWPVPGDPLLFNPRNFPGCTMLADIDWTLSVLVGGSTARAVGALGAAQVDRLGNLNSTRLPDRMLMGSGGANDVVTCARETVVVAAQSRERFVERVAYVTAPGGRVRSVVSQLGTYEKDGDELVLVAVAGDDVDAGVREAREACGWDLRVAREVRRVEPPTREELHTLRLMDPAGWFRS